MKQNRIVKQKKRVKFFKETRTHSSWCLKMPVIFTVRKQTIRETDGSFFVAWHRNFSYFKFSASLRLDWTISERLKVSLNGCHSHVRQRFHSRHPEDNHELLSFKREGTIDLWCKLQPALLNRKRTTNKLVIHNSTTCSSETMNTWHWQRDQQRAELNTTQLLAHLQSLTFRAHWIKSQIKCSVTARNIPDSSGQDSVLYNLLFLWCEMKTMQCGD
jgi:hypothetical protein